MAERQEAAGDIIVKVADNETVTVETLSLNEEFDVELIYGSGFQFPSGYAIKNARFSGSMTIKGNRKELKDKFFDSNGLPKVCDAITVNHMPEEDSQGNEIRDTTSYQEMLVTNKGYEMNDGEIVDTTFEWVAMGVDDGTGQD